MKYRIQKIFDRFVCQGADCEATCCEGWKIEIDRESYEAYKKIRGKLGLLLLLGIDPKTRCFRMRRRACVFYNSQGLCNLYKELGRDGLCQGCKDYPRHKEDYGDLQEVMLSLSCPEAARMILEDESFGAWVEKIPENKGEESGRKLWEVSRKILVDLEKVREVLNQILKDRQIPWKQRLAMGLAFAHDVQRHWDTDEDRTWWVGELSRRYLAPGAPERFHRKMQRLREDKSGSSPKRPRWAERRIRLAGWLRQMGPMEPVLEGWKKTLDEMCTVLYHEWDWDTYHRFCEEFDRENEGLEQEWENLVLYFLNTYLLGAVYDGDVFGKVKLAVFGVLVIRERCLFVYGTKGKTGREELIKAAWQYSRQVENSDHNLEFLETDFLMNPLFGLHAMLEVLQ